MRKILLVLVCFVLTFNLCACSENTNNGETTENSFKTNIIIEGGVEKNLDSDPSKTPLIHEAIELFYKHNYSGYMQKITLALEAGEFDPVIYYHLGYIYNFGLGVEIDKDIAMDMYAKGAEYNNTTCIYNLAILYSQKGDDDKCMELLRKASELGSAVSDVVITYFEHMPYSNLSSALYDIASTSNDPTAIYKAADIIIKYGLNDAGDVQKSIELMNSAGQLGLAEAYIRIASIYRYGNVGVDNDQTKIFEYCLKAAETLELKDYYDEVGYCYEYGYGVEKNYEKAFEYYKLATQDNYGIAWFDLGRMYENGTGVEKNLGKAIECYVNGSKDPNPEYSHKAISKLNQIYKNEFNN